MVRRNAFADPSTGDQAAHRSVSAKDGAAGSTTPSATTSTPASMPPSTAPSLWVIRVSRPVILSVGAYSRRDRLR